jgi:hypothetical protein
MSALVAISSKAQPRKSPASHLRAMIPNKPRFRNRLRSSLLHVPVVVMKPAIPIPKTRRCADFWTQLKEPSVLILRANPMTPSPRELSPQLRKILVND